MFTTVKNDLKKYLGKEVKINKLVTHQGSEPFYNSCVGVIEEFEHVYVIVRRTDLTDNGRPLYITFKYADFLMKEYEIKEV